ncbi:MAG TPA: hypothetical protein PKL97_03795 [Candidatus Omnitrophota bacterium]|nr:hypothetical protein [Candidatus Omnitrophota bacterium]
MKNLTFLISGLDSKNGGIVLIAALLALSVLAIGIGAFFLFGFADYSASVRSENLAEAFYLAEAGLDEKIVQGTTDTLNGNLGSGTYQVVYNCVDVNGDNGNAVCGSGADDQESLISTGTVAENGATYTRTIRAEVTGSPAINVRGAISLNGDASTLGAMISDGRDHNDSGNLTGAPGVFGLSTHSAVLNQGGNSQIGGNGQAPARPANPISYETSAPELPNTPEQVLGMNPGDLDQYKTDQLPSGGFTNAIVYLTQGLTAVDLDGCSGILICHNDAGTATLKNLHGTFKGVIISDNICHINGNAEIVGAVFSLHQTSVIANGSAEVKYSSSILSKLPVRRFNISSWEDTRND